MLEFADASNFQSDAVGVALVVKKRFTKVTRPVTGMKTCTLTFGTTALGKPVAVGAVNDEKKTGDDKPLFGTGVNCVMSWSS